MADLVAARAPPSCLAGREQRCRALCRFKKKYAVMARIQGWEKQKSEAVGTHPFEESDESGEETAGERTTRVGRTRGGMKVAARIGRVCC